jgi:hypothetical protein
MIDELRQLLESEKTKMGETLKQKEKELMD